MAGKLVLFSADARARVERWGLESESLPSPAGGCEVAHQPLNPES